MSQTKYHLEPDVKQSALALVKGYDRRVRAYHEARYDIINSSPCAYETYTRAKPDGRWNAIQREQLRTMLPRGSTSGNPTQSKAERLAKLEESVETLRMRAVEQAKWMIGLDVRDEALRQRLVVAIWDSCIKGRDFTFEYCNLPVSKTNFYERRLEFLSRIAVSTSYL